MAQDTQREPLNLNRQPLLDATVISGVAAVFPGAGGEGVVISGGAGGADPAGPGGGGGGAVLQGAAGGAGTDGGAGGDVLAIGGTGGAGTAGAGGDGGNVILQGGVAGTSADGIAKGGDASIDGGLGGSSGVAGIVKVGTDQASAIVIGRTGIDTVFRGSHRRAVSIIATNTSLDASHDIVLVVGSVFIVLPSATDVIGRIYTIKNNGGSGPVTVVAAEGQLIDGAPTQSLPNRYDALILVSDGAEWLSVGEKATTASPPTDQRIMCVTQPSVSTSHTGTLAETTIFQWVISAGAMWPPGTVRGFLRFAYSKTGVGTDATLRVRRGSNMDDTGGTVLATETALNGTNGFFSLRGIDWSEANPFGVHVLKITVELADAADILTLKALAAQMR